MNDLISRQAAKDVVDMELDTIDHVPEWVYDKLLTALDKAPSAQPERKNGKWLRSGNCIFPYECDQCEDTNERATPFCPNCGADMRQRGEQDET